MKYIPSLDGIRAVAIIVVIFSHWQFPLCHGGFLGVDLFFVLSGYLITAILLQEWEQSGDVNLRDFYLRRALRLMPALVTLLALYVMLAIPLAHHLAFHLKTTLFALCYVSNWIQAFKLPFASALSHTWSLSVEEQYYALWPFCLLLILRMTRTPKGVFRLTLCVTAFCLGIFMLRFYEGSSIDYLFLATDTRIWTILSGATVATLVHSGWKPSSLWLGGAAAGGWLVLGGYLVAASIDHPGLFQFIGITLASLAVVTHGALEPHSLPGRLLSWRPLVKIGRISYGLYLWHYPIAVGLFRFFPKGGYAWKFMLGNALSFSAAYLCHRFVEIPIQRIRPRPSFPVAVEISAS